jgi:flagellar hook-associated protein 2
VKSSNTFSDVIPGVTITLRSESTSSVSITINNDVDTIQQNIEDFVSAYNDLVDYIDAKTEYSTLTNTGEELADETIPDRILSRLKSILTSRVSGQPEDLRTLAQLGITTDYQTGHLEIDSSTLTDKLTNDLETVETLFTNSTDGIASELYDYLDDVTDSTSGPIATRIDGLEDLISDIDDDITDMEEHLSIMEERLRKQFAALESMLTEMNNQSAFLSRLFT